MTVRFTNLDREFGFPEGTLDSVWAQETGRGRNNVSSSAGARGHFQFMPRTRDEMLRNHGIDAWSSDPEVAARAAGTYLRQQVRMFNGDLSRGLAAYNAGAGNVQEAGRGANWLSRMSRETRNYVPQILGRIGTSVDEIDSEEQYTIQRQARIDSGRTATPEELAEDERHANRRRGILEAGGVDTREMSTDQLLGQMFFALIAGLIQSAISQGQAQSPQRSAPQSTPSFSPPTTPLPTQGQHVADGTAVVPAPTPVRTAAAPQRSPVPA